MSTALLAALTSSLAQSQTTELVSVTTGGAQANLNSEAVSISGDGRYVAFTSVATNLVPGDVNGTYDVFVRDVQAGTTELGSMGAGGVPANYGGQSPSISADGRFLAFQSFATNLNPADTNGRGDVYVRDRQLGTVERVSRPSGPGQADDDSSNPAISADGRFVALLSRASNLVAGDSNGRVDVFVRESGPLPPAGFCSGDGTATACPCSPSYWGAGCPNSAWSVGAHLGASGRADLSADTLALSAAWMSASSALYFQGTTQVAGGMGVVFGDGLRCVGGNVVRLGIQTSVNGRSWYPGAGDAPISVRGQVTSPGVRDYQVWYRNAAGFCTPATFNLTNGYEVTWIP